MDRGDRFHARGTGPRWPEDAGRRCWVREVTWTARDESARSRVLRDVTQVGGIPEGEGPEPLFRACWSGWGKGQDKWVLYRMCREL